MGNVGYITHFCSELSSDFKISGEASKEMFADLFIRPSFINIRARVDGFSPILRA